MRTFYLLGVLEVDDFDEAREIVQGFGFTDHLRVCGKEAKALAREAGFKARRQVVEHTAVG